MRAILIMAPFLFIACEKSTGEIGLGQVVDSKAVLGTKKNIPIVTYNIPFDSVRSSNPTREIVGKYIDPYFGGVTAKMQTHLLLSLLSPSFGPKPICDSVVMFLRYSGYYGDTAMPVTFIVSELGEYLDPDDTIYSNKDYALYGELGRITQQPRPNTPVYDEDDTLRASLKLNLDKHFFQRRLLDASRLSPESFTTNIEFIKHLFGIQISTEDYADGLVYFDIQNLASYVKVYYRESPSDTVLRNYEMYYGIYSSGNFFSVNSFSQDVTLGGPNYDMQDTVNGEPTILSQAMGGTVTQINLPDLKEFKDSNWVLNRAELVFHVREGSVGKYPLPPSLYLLEYDGKTRLLIDDYLSGGLSPEGDLEIGYLRNRSYTFNMTRLIHRYINTTDTIFPLILMPEASASNGYRAVLGGNNDPVQPVEFNMYYTKPKN